MITLIFATNNRHKIAELQASAGAALKFITLEDAGITIDIPEPYNSLSENAAAKARTIYEITRGMNCFSEDTGLEVGALKGEPGVRSARYAGEGKSSSDNIDKLLLNLGDNPDRRARFRTVIALLMDQREYFFEGICEGTILRGRKGEGGFGYDPVFVPQGSLLSFAQMTMEEKGRYSHRKKAADELIRFLHQQPKYFNHGQD
jgi:XTP/dITP diphosphohydrolase